MGASLTGGAVIELQTGERHQFDTLNPMMGCASQVELLTALNAKTYENGMLWVNEHQSTSIAGLYAASDVVHALNQMAVGAAHAATASTAICRTLPVNYR